MNPLWSPFGGMVTLQSLREQAAGWNLRGAGPRPQAQGALQTSAHRVGYPDQPSWLTAGTWLDLIDDLGTELANGALTVQLVAGEGRNEAPVWSHLRFEALARSHGWSLTVRRPGATVAWTKAVSVDTVEIVEWVRKAAAALASGRDDFWQGDPLVTRPEPAPELPVWEGLSREPDGTWRLGYFRSTLSWDPSDLSDLVDLAWAAGLSRAWLVPGPTLVFRGIPAAVAGDWRQWLATKRRVSQRSQWHRVVRPAEPVPELTAPLRNLVELLEATDRWPSHPVVLGTETTDREDGLFSPGHTLILPTPDGWRWRSADGLSAGEGDSDALLPVLFSAPSPVAPTRPRAPSTRVSESRICRSCQNIYSPAWGDPLAAVPPGVAFDGLPADWECPVCGSPPSLYSGTGGDHARDTDSH